MKNDICTRLLIMALFVIAKTKEKTLMVINRQLVEQLEYNHTTEYYAVF